MASADGSAGAIQDGTKKMSRENWKKQKELEEARKLGNAPAEVDEEGRFVPFWDSGRLVQCVSVVRIPQY